MPEPLTIEGYLRLLHDDDYGPALDINGQLLPVLLAEHFSTCACCDLHAGYVRLTIEFLDEQPYEEVP